MNGDKKMDKFTQALLSAPEKGRFKTDKYYLNRLTGEIKVVIHPVQVPKSKFWIIISKRAYLELDK